MRYYIPLIAGLMGLAACDELPGGGLASLVDPGGTIVSRGEGPPDARPGACYGRDTTPAIVETVTEQVMLHPPQIDSSGTVQEPGVFITETSQRIVQERRELWFETPCAAENDPDFIAALQRALQARGLLRGPINSEMDNRTRRAIRRYQEPQGLDSSVLSLAAARQLGLSVWDPEAAARGSGGG